MNKEGQGAGRQEVGRDSQIGGKAVWLKEGQDSDRLRNREEFDLSLQPSHTSLIN